MGLAILEYRGLGRGGHAFSLELGANRYWSYAVGGEEVTRWNGLKMLAERGHTSRLFGPLPDPALGRAAFTVPAAQLDTRQRFIQVLSFRDRDRRGPALSDIVEVPGVGSGWTPGGGAGRLELPVLNFSKLSKDGTDMQTKPQVVPFSVREERPMSEAMFLGALTSLLPSLLPAIGGLFGGGGGGAAGGGDLLKKLASPDVLKTITGLIGQISSAKTYAESDRLVEAAALSRHFGAGGNGERNRVRGFASGGEPMSEAMVAPALLAALPALMPLLKQVLKPETIKAVNEGLGPKAAIGAITDSVTKIGKLGLQGQKQLMDHLEKNMPKLADEDRMIDLLENMSVAAGVEPRYRAVSSVKLDFPDLVSHVVYGRTRIVYGWGRDLTFPLSVETPREIRRGAVNILIKRPDDLGIVAQGRWKVTDVDSGLLPGEFTFPREKLARLEPGEDYLVSAFFTWKTRSGRRYGTAREMLITVMRDYSFDRVEPGGEPVQLNDPAAYRDYWHRIWQGSFDRESRRYDLSCRYYHSFRPRRRSLGKMESEVRLDEPEGRTRRGEVRSGTLFDPASLNRLIPRLTGERELGEEELRALDTPDFRKHCDQAARTAVRFRGRPGQACSLWVYPAVRIDRLVLKKVTRGDANGHVTGMEDHPVSFPMPAMVHFVGLLAE
jgi:hypothetical protein